ncbi:myotubularin-related protein 7a [Chanos chanos]|uniref:Myotubularin-related protein 7a n=1 Tax=Chanos chanos TaxID=29144 RepID=A0A6J2URR6_CHACN|nr:myotubularin-related protein 7-like [Chanos chanos]
MEYIKIPKAENVCLVNRGSTRKAAVGTLYLTATHTIFIDQASEINQETWVLHSLVDSVERQCETATGYPLLIHCKNFQVIQFIFPQEMDCHEMLVSLRHLSRPDQFEKLYCFSFNANLDKKEREQTWEFVDLRAEYRRMGLPNKQWHLTHINREYRVCDTYPADLFVPKSATLPVIVGSSKFRSRGRFPTLSYYCKETHAAVCRSSQPLSGFSARCLEDEHMLEAVMKSNPGSRFMYVVDTRPKMNAVAYRASGKGYENEDNYSNIKFQFFGIENIHVMRNSQQKLLEVCELRTPSMGDFLSGLEYSGWLKHIKAILDAGIFIAKAVAEEGVSVLVHCSDGWDRTTQVCSVASVLLDPYYRTLKGLMVLIEKDWVAFGHKFSHRYNHLDGDLKEVSPVIDQFLECVWNLMEQFPCAFEYNENFLITIHNHIYSCQYGNFICNSQKEKRDMRIKDRTHSIWTHLFKNKTDFMNPLFRPDHNQTQGLLRPLTAPYCFKFWVGLYNRFEKGVHPRQSVLDCLVAVREKTQRLEEEMTDYGQKIAGLKREQRKSSYMKGTLLNDNQTAWGVPTQISLVNSTKSLDADLSTNSESGVADFSCHSTSSGGESLLSEDGIKDPDSDEALSTTA